jgi:hypothetical protein
LRRLGGNPRVGPFQKLEQLTWEIHSFAPLGRGCRGISVYRVTEKGGQVPPGAEKKSPRARGIHNFRVCFVRGQLVMHRLLDERMR